MSDLLGSDLLGHVLIFVLWFVLSLLLTHCGYCMGRRDESRKARKGDQ